MDLNGNSGNNPCNERKKATFIVKLEDCQNDTWQGRIVWAEANKSTHFRSSLEMMKLMDGALRECKLSLDEYNIG